MHELEDIKGGRDLTDLAQDSYHAQLNKQSELDLKVQCQYLLKSVRLYVQQTVSEASEGLKQKYKIWLCYSSMIFSFKLYKICCYLGHRAKKMKAYDHKRHY